MTENTNDPKQDFVEPEVSFVVPAASEEKPEAEVVNGTEPKTEVPKQEKEKLEPSYTLGDYKRLTKISTLNINGEELPLTGKAVFDYSPFRDRKESDNTRTPVSFPSMGVAAIANSRDAISSLDFKNSEEARQWAQTVDQATHFNTVNDSFFKALNRENADWIQVPRFNNIPLVASKASQPEYKDRELKDSQALMYALAGLGLGTPAQSPMWHSGFWVSFRPALEDAWINFNDRITMDKIRIGRATSGLTFSNINAIFIERSLEFALEHLLDHNIRLASGSDRRTILKKLRAPDINHFLWAFLMANHPDGYPISRACSAAPGNCTNIIQETINLRILQVTDKASLIDAHLAHMAKSSTGGVSEEEVDLYQSTLIPIQPAEVDLLETSEMKVKAKLAVPSAEDYIQSGRRWFDGIVQLVDGVIGKDVSDNQREKTYQAYAKAATLREYSHWIKEIHLNSNKVVDLLTLENLLTNLSPRADLRKNFYKQIDSYIERSVVSIIALPNYPCPECKKSQYENKPENKFVDCIPLDVAQAFFSLALLRTMELTNR